MIYVLILWTFGCTSFDGPECVAGDFTVHSVSRSQHECETRAQAWIASDPNNKWFCTYVPRSQRTIAGRPIPRDN
jgi:hypothetical protein